MSALPVCEVLDDGTVVELRAVAHTVSVLEEMEPGPLAMALLQSLRGVSLDVGQRVAVAAGWQRQAAWVAAQGARALAAVNADVEAVPAAEVVAEWEWRQELVAAALRWLELTRLCGHSDLERVLGEGVPDGASDEVPGGVPGVSGRDGP